MKTALTVLLRVKTLKEEGALREANDRRKKALQAAAETERARKLVQDSLSTLEKRQDAIFADIMRRVVNMDDIEQTKARVVVLEKEHGKLVDGESRALHLQAEADAAREKAIQTHRISLRAVDKYVLMTDRERAEQDALAQMREETEIEDLFGTNRRRLP